MPQDRLHPVFCLSLHAAYRCRHSGECCTAGWPIPVEATLRPHLDAALRAGRLVLPGGGKTPFVDDDDLPAETAGIVRSDPAGVCACYQRDRRRCAIHAQLGQALLPASCQHFPRVCLIDRDAAFVTLSHYCPTAAALLGVDLPLTVVGAPPDFAPFALEGLDARDALPPLLRPGLLADRESYRRWERQVVAYLGKDSTAEDAMGRVVHFTERLRGWEPRRGTLNEAIDEAAAARGGPDSTLTQPAALGASGLGLDRLVRQAVPAGLTLPAAPGNVTEIFDRLVAPAWDGFASSIRRYLAARAFGNWCAYQGHGLRTVVCSVVAALNVLRVEAARHCAGAGRTLDGALLTAAFRSADLLLVHLASREGLAARLSEVEKATAEELTEAL